jgi:hypothetical protein
MGGREAVQAAERDWEKQQHLSEVYVEIVPELDLEEGVLGAPVGQRHSAWGGGHAAVLEEAPVAVAGAGERGEDQGGAESAGEGEEVADLQRKRGARREVRGE